MDNEIKTSNNSARSIRIIGNIIVIIGIGSSYEYQCQIEDDLAEKELFEPFDNDTIVKVESDTLIHYH